jgi:hypothetical protein
VARSRCNQEWKARGSNSSLEERASERLNPPPRSTRNIATPTSIVPSSRRRQSNSGQVKLQRPPSLLPRFACREKGALFCHIRPLGTSTHSRLYPLFHTRRLVLPVGPISTVKLAHPPCSWHMWAPPAWLACICLTWYCCHPPAFISFVGLASLRSTALWPFDILTRNMQSLCFPGCPLSRRAGEARLRRIW